MENSSLDIKLDRFDRVYRPGDIIRGSVNINAKKGWTHNGLVILVEGTIHTLAQASGLSLSGETQQAQCVFQHKDELLPSGKVPDGVTEVPFEFLLRGNVDGENQLWESYHGVYISVVYIITATCDRGMLKKSLKREIEFIVEIPQESKPKSKSKEKDVAANISADPVEFNISPQTIENVDKSALRNIPDFSISGRLHRTLCSVNRPFTGEVNILNSVSAIRSIELQLARLESVVNISSSSGAFHQEASEVMRIQIGEGNLCRDMLVPIYMVFPRLHACPTLRTPMFKIEFEINLIIIFDDGHVITENFPIHIIRD